MVYGKGTGERGRGGCSRFWRFGAGSPERTLPAHSTSGWLATLAAFALLVGGPASASTRQPMNGNLNSVLGAAEACVARVKASPEYAPLRKHLKEADYSLVSDRDIPLALDEASRVQACEKPLTEESFSSVYPSLAVILQEDFARSHDNLIALVRKKESWGDYVRRGNILRAEFSEKFKREVRRIEVASAAHSPSSRGATQASDAPSAKGLRLGRYGCYMSLGGGWTAGPVIHLYTGGFELTPRDRYDFVDKEHRVSGESGAYYVKNEVMYFTSGTLKGSHASINMQNGEVYLVRAEFKDPNNSNLAALSCWHSDKRK